MHQKQPPAKIAASSPAGGGFSWPSADGAKSANALRTARKKWERRFMAGLGFVVGGR